MRTLGPDTWPRAAATLPLIIAGCLGIARHGQLAAGDPAPQTPPAPGAVAPQATSPAPILDLPTLRETVARFLTAEQQRDWATVYRLVAPLIKDEVGTLEEFVAYQEEEEEPRLVSWAVLRIEPPEQPVDFAKEMAEIEPDDPAFGLKIDSGAGVSMDVTYVGPDGTRERRPAQLDIWVHIDGRWLWMWREEHPEKPW